MIVSDGQKKSKSNTVKTEFAYPLMATVRRQVPLGINAATYSLRSDNRTSYCNVHSVASMPIEFHNAALNNTATACTQ